jgi:hypothetical protein
VFANTQGEPLDYSNVYSRVWVKARDATGIEGAEVGAFHSFRRTLGSLVHERGAKTDRQLSDWLGHHDPAFTVREYVGQMDQGLGDAEFLDKLIPAQWATDGQQPTHQQPQTGNGRNGDDPHRNGGSTNQPQTVRSTRAAS